MAHKTWLITGASRGFGFEITKAVLAAGDSVIATVRSKPGALAAQLDNSPSLKVVVTDITDETQTNAAIAEAIAFTGKIDVLVNNAGFGLLAAVEEASAQEVRDNFETNVFGLLNVTRAVLPFMRGQGSGHIINISSVGGLTGYIGWGIYGATKFAVEGITESLAQELAPLGIHATVVSPGFFRTDFLDATSLTRTGNVIEDYHATVGAMRSFASQVNKKQPGDPQKLAQALIQLANAPQPPVHLPLGNDTLAAYKAKAARFDNEIREWEAVITGTDHDDVKAGNI